MKRKRKTMVEAFSDLGAAVRDLGVAVVGLVEVQGAEVCTVHEDGVLLETGAGRCDEACDSRECIGAPLYRRAAR